MTSVSLCLLVVAVASASCGRLDHLAGAAYAGASASAGAYSAPPSRFENVHNGDGSYRFSFDGNGISAHESGSPRAAGPEGAAVTAEGGFSYRAPDGQQVSLTYTADENGFHPVGSHLPTPPPIPEEILRSIEFNRQHPSSVGQVDPPPHDKKKKWVTFDYTATFDYTSTPSDRIYTPIPEERLRPVKFNRQHLSSDEGSYNGGRNAYRY